MDPHFWPTIEDIFSRAMRIPLGQRAEFVNSQTSDPKIRQEVSSLLKHATRSEAFLESNDESTVGRALTDVARELDWSSRPIRLDGPDSDSDPVDENHRNLEITRDLAERLKREFAERLPQYELKGLLGSGGEAAVFSALDKQLDRRVAVRVLFLAESGNQNRDRIIRESRTLSRIHNEHVVTIFSVHVDGELALLISELVDGPTMKQLLVSQGALRPRVAADLIRQAALGVSAAHQLSIIHCDIKPRNILLTPGTGHESGYLAKISDFGFADEGQRMSALLELAQPIEAVSNSIGRTGSVISGTLPYICPERIESKKFPDEAADVYGLGVSLYEALTGQLPYRGARHMLARQILAGNPVHPRRLDDRIPEDLENICLKAMARDASLRYPTAALLAEDLRRFLDGQQTSVRPASPIRKLGRFAGRNWQSIVFGSVATALLMVLVAGAILALTMNRNRQNELQSIKNTIADVRASELLMADHGMLKFAISKMGNLDEATIEKIRQVGSDPASDAYQRLNAAIIRLHLGEDVLPEIVRLLPEVSISPALLQLLLAAPESVGDLGRKTAGLSASQSNPEFRTQLALMAWSLGDSGELGEICNDLKQPDLRTRATMLLKDWHPAIEDLVARIRQDPDPMIQYCLVTGMGRMDPRSLHRFDVRLITELLSGLSGDSSTARVRAACVWTAKKLEIAGAGNAMFPIRKGKDWEQTTTGISLVRLEPGTMMLGALDPRIEGDFNLPHATTMTRPFWIASTETSVAMYRTFLNDQDLDTALKPFLFDGWLPDTATSPTPNHPVTRVSWIDAVLFCNWLSEREGLKPCYVFEKPDETQEYNLVDFAASIQTDFSANGFRLPTEAESEFASRSGGQSNHWFGDDNGLINELVSTSARFVVPAKVCGDLMPNPHGLHEMEGNVWEWSQDWYEQIGTDSLTDPRGPDAPDPQFGIRKAYRGGGVNTQRGSAEVSARGHDDPSSRWANLGFRVMRQESEDSLAK